MLLNVASKNVFSNLWWMICLRLSHPYLFSTPLEEGFSSFSSWKSKCRNLHPSTSLHMWPFNSVSSMAQNPVFGIWLHFTSNRNPGYKWRAPNFSNHTKVTANFFECIEYSDFFRSKANLINPIRPLCYALCTEDFLPGSTWSQPCWDIIVPSHCSEFNII